MKHFSDMIYVGIYIYIYMYNEIQVRRIHNPRLHLSLMQRRISSTTNFYFAASEHRSNVITEFSNNPHGYTVYVLTLFLFTPLI
jgi:hypothetical protein